MLLMGIFNQGIWFVLGTLSIRFVRVSLGKAYDKIYKRTKTETILSSWVT